MTDALTPVWLICGGQSPEHDVSLSSGRTAAAHLSRSRYSVRPVYIRRDGLWAVADKPLEEKEDAGRVFDRLTTSAQVIDAGLAVSRASAESAVALLILHGAYGEDGTLQGMLEMAGIPYTGSGVLASSLAMDKVRCQRLLQGTGIPVARFVSSERADLDAAQLMDRALDEVGLPCVVKPSRAGSSFGISIVHDRELLAHAIETAAAVDPLVMVEAFVKGEELTCGIVQRVVNGELRNLALPLTAIRPRTSAFFDFEAKYTPGECEEIVPAPVSEEIRDTIQALSLRAFEHLGCRDMTRIDFIWSPKDGPFLLDVNTIPGMTPTSLLPQQAIAAGISFPELLEGFISNAITRNCGCGTCQD